MPRSPGRIDTGGDPELAAALADALRAAQADRDTALSLTHPFHSYPARMHPATARVLVSLVGEGAPRTAPLVDPFCGSGTVLVEARAAGLRGIGVDLNPLAVLVSRAKTWTVPARRKVRDAAHDIAGAVLAAGKAARRGGAESTPHRAPRGFDPNARDRRLASWFAPHVRRELELVAAKLDDLRARDAELADVLTACLSAVLYKVSSRSSDTDPTWVARAIARGAAARLFVQRAELLAAGLDDLAHVRGPTAEVFEMDTRRLGEVVADGSAAAVVTSPPYAGTYDYAEHQRLRFDFLTLRHRDYDAGEIGSRRSFERDTDAAHAWRAALADCVAAIGRALHPGRRAALLIGDSLARNRAMWALDDVRGALTDDLFLEAWASQQRPMLGGSERRAFGDRGKAEHAIVLRRR
jgi:SAM-dependent methyltransferase